MDTPRHRMNPTTRTTNKIAPRTTRRRRRLPVAIAVASVAIAPHTSAAAPLPTPTEVVTNRPSHVSLSADGRSVVYTAIDDDDNTIVMLASATPGTSGGEPRSLVTIGEARRGGDTIMPVLSGDGCVVVAVSQVALDLFHDDDGNQRWDVYRLVLPECGGTADRWELVSSDDSGIALDSASPDNAPAVSMSGSTIAYTSTNRSGRSSVHVVDLTLPATQPRTLTVPEPDGSPTLAFRYRGTDQPALSGDGTRLVFRSDFDSTHETVEWSPGPILGEDAATQVYVWDLDDQTINLVSQRDDVPASHGAKDPAISADGSTVAFVASDPELDPTVGWQCDPHCSDQVLVARYDDGWAPPSVVSASPLATPVEDGPESEITTGDRRSWGPQLAGDGSQVAFLTRATNLTATHARPSSNPLAGDVVIATTSTDDNGSDDIGRQSTPPTPVDNSAPRWADHTGFSVSSSMATTVYDVSRVTDGFIVDEMGGRSTVSISTPSSLAMADVDFGTVLDGMESDELFTVVRNEGPVGFRPANVAIDSDRFEVTGGSCATGAIVPPGGTCSVYMTFTPSGGGSSAATLEVAGSEGHSVTATVTGQAGNPGLRVDPGGIDAGTIAVGTTSDPATLSVQNYGFEPITIKSVNVGGAHSDEFSLSSDQCSGVVVEPEGSCDVGVIFVPHDDGDRWATLRVDSHQGPATAAILTAAATRAPEISITADELLTVDGQGFAADSSITVSLVGDDVLYTVTADANGAFRLTDVVAASGPDLTIVARSTDGSWAFARATVRVERPTPTFLPGFGVG